MKDVINLRLPCNPEFVNVARMTVSVVANNIKMNYEVIQDLKVAVSEACNNVIQHSNSQDFYEIDFYPREEKITIDIKDFGDGFELKNYEKPDLENPKEGGLGIFIIESLMDKFEIITDNNIGTTVRMIKNKEG
ncbi:MAG: ATP-binding protein [Bacillota bacterium]